MIDKKNIILISPLAGIHDSLTTTIPLPLLAISRRINRDKYNLIIVDQKMPGWIDRLKHALSGDVLAAAITSLTGDQLYYGSLIAKQIKKFNKDIKIIWGGIHPSSSANQMLKEDFVDFVIIGEGEDTFPAIIESLAENKDLSSVDSIGYKLSSGAIKINPTGKLLDVNELEELPYDIIDMQEYLNGIEDREFFIEGARGCIYNCTYCYNPTYNRRTWRPMSPKKIVSNMKNLKSTYGINNFFIIDDSFFISKPRIEEFTSLLLENGLKIKWSCEANFCSLERLSDDQIKRLVDSGLNWIAMGVESGSKKVRTLFNKDMNIEHLIEFNKKISKYKLNVRYNFMTGSVMEEKDDLLETVKLINILLKDNPYAMVQPVYITVPYPGTQYLLESKMHGLKEPSSLLEWSNFDSYYAKKILPWLNGSKGQISELLMYSSYFIDNKVEYHLSDSSIMRFFKFVVKIYKPIAQFRFNNLFHMFFIEKYIIKFINLSFRKINKYKIDNMGTTI